MKHTEKTIQKALWSHYISHKYRMLNVCFFPNAEADWLSWVASGYCYEVEIKTSRSDFRADFKKPKHKMIQGCIDGEKYVAVKSYDHHNWTDNQDEVNFMELTETKKSYRERYNRETKQYENVIRYKEHISCDINWQNNEDTPNKFWYIVPTDLIKLSEVPDYAGLMYIDDNGKITIQRQAPFIHKKKHNPADSFNKMYYCYEHQVRELLKLV